MARKPRFAPAGLVYHVMNRTWGKIELFEDAGDYEAFERVLAQALVRHKQSLQLLAYCLMPNHFHLVLKPAADGQLSRFMQWLTMTQPSAGTPIATAPGAGISTKAASKVSPCNAMPIS